MGGGEVPTRAPSRRPRRRPPWSPAIFSVPLLTGGGMGRARCPRDDGPCRRPRNEARNEEGEHHRSSRRQASAGPPSVIVFDHGNFRLGWESQSSPTGVRMEREPIDTIPRDAYPCCVTSLRPGALVTSLRANQRRRSDIKLFEVIASIVLIALLAGCSSANVRSVVRRQHSRCLWRRVML